MRMAKLIFPAGKLIPVPLGVVKSLGRADIARYSEAVTVSRVQCTVENVLGEDGQPILKLTSQGSQNPTVVVGPSEQALDLQNGQSAFLGDGASFSLISTRPDLAITVQLDRDLRVAPGGGTLQPAVVAGVTEGEADVTVPVIYGSEMTTEPTVTTPRPEGGAAQKGSVEFGDARADPVATRGKVITATAKTDSYSSPSEAYTSVSGGSSAAAAGEGGDSDVDGDARPIRVPMKKSSATPPTGGSGGGGQGSSVGGKGGKARGVGNHKPVSPLSPPVLLLLAGLPGSGKSTFSRELLAASPVAWVHVNQDAIRGGKPGTRQQCISAVRTALEEGACCVVDRCHADADQRSVLRTVASDLGFAAHCVALQTPLELCVKRVAGRSDHPGGVQGKGSQKVVYMAAGQMKGNSWPPAASEGFASIMDCHNDADAAAAVRAWALYGTHGGDEVQNYGSIKAPALTAAAAGTDDGNRKNETKLRPPAVTVAVPATHGSAKVPQKASASADADVAAAATLAMWSEYVAKRKPVSTGIMSFFKRAGTAGKQGPGGAGAAGAAMPAPKAVAFGLREMNASEARGAAAPGGVAAAPAGAPAQASKVAATGKGPREAGGKGSPASGAVTLSGQRRPRTETAAAVAEECRAKRREVDVAQASRGSDVAAVGGGDAAAGQAGNRPVGSLQVRVKDAAGSESQGHGESVPHCSDSPAARNAFAVLMASASRQAADGHGGTSGGGGSGGDGAGPNQPKHRGGAATGEPDSRFKLSAPWAQALRNTALHPEKAQQDVLYQDDLVVLIRDAFPKAKHHALVVARDPMLRSIADLRKEHLPMLAHMKEVASRWVQEERSKDPVTVAFKLGFHSVPSMAQLHMHAVSQDFYSPALKNKKHWNSFTTRFFLPLHVVESELASRGHIMIIAHAEQEQLEGQELRCHGCTKPMKSMPELKKHIVACDAVKRLPGI